MSTKKRSKFEAAIRAHRDDEAARLQTLKRAFPGVDAGNQRAPLEDDPNYRYVSVSE